MKNELPKKWLNNLEILDIAFQPIINIHTGKIFAVEALLRNYQEVGFASIFSLFDQVYKENVLYSFDIELREKAIRKFTKINGFEDIKLFYNLDNRLFEMPNFTQGNTSKILKQCGVTKDNICFEISERHEISDDSNMQNILEHYKNSKYCIAIDDFGVGHSGYKLLYDSMPNIIKIDRFFLTDIEKNIKKKLMVRSITHLAIQLGIKVVAEGVETREELLTCRDIGCHLVQGYFVQRPTTDTKEILKEYVNIIDLIHNDKRVITGECKMETYLDKKPSLPVTTNMSLVIDYFKKHSDSSIIPIVNSNDEPLGILEENRIKEFLYSPYGRSLMLNDGTKKSKLENLLQPCGIADINSGMSTIIELFTNNPESLGIILTNNSKYYGFLSARAIITIMNEQNLLFAREQNPLTKLPGNTMIEKYISDVTVNENSYILCYFDLDNFKAFNDVYGFRNGDRVIQLFADILRKNLSKEFFKAHIGGDDFFTAVQCSKENEQIYIAEIFNIVTKFTDDVRDFYSDEDKERGFIVSADRDGMKKSFPLLTVSASILIIGKNTKKRCQESINKILSIQKKVAKEEVGHLSISTLL
jgi:EAL domain-containing protein (putative c-di-GMP-specific phosphodiesterase class I)/GGDEF domain-containing protein